MGSDFVLVAGTDIGTTLGTALTVNRSTLLFTLGGALSFASTSSITGAASTDLNLNTTTAGSIYANASGTGGQFVVYNPGIASTGAMMRIATQSATDRPAAIHFQPITSKYGWMIGAQYNVNDGFEITPSTATGGSTFTTPLFKAVASTGVVTLSNGVTVTANAIAAANSVTSASGQALVLGTGTTGPALSIASATNIITQTGAGFVNSNAAPYISFSTPGWSGGAQAYFGANLNPGTSSAGDYFAFNVPTGKGYSFAIAANSALTLNAASGLDAS